MPAERAATPYTYLSELHFEKEIYAWMMEAKPVLFKIINLQETIYEI